MKAFRRGVAALALLTMAFGGVATATREIPNSSREILPFEPQTCYGVPSIVAYKFGPQSDLEWIGGPYFVGKADQTKTAGMFESLGWKPFQANSYFMYWFVGRIGYNDADDRCWILPVPDEVRVQILQPGLVWGTPP